MDADGSKKKNEKKNKKTGKKDTSHWAVQVFFISVLLSGALSFASGEILNEAGLIPSCIVLAFFILLGIVFDIIGVAVTAADPKPFHSMAARRIPGAKEALSMIRKASRVSSFCNDVVGDICGIISGTTAAVIVTRLQSALSVRSALIALVVTALVSGLTIGGKAIGKALAIERSTTVLQLVGRILHLFSREKKKR